MQTIYCSLIVVRETRATQQYWGEIRSVLDLDPQAPVTIPEGPDQEEVWGRLPNGRAGVIGYRNKNDVIYAVTIWPGWDMRGVNNERLCHHCYAERRRRGWAVSVDGPLNQRGHSCAECGRHILAKVETKSQFFTKKRPAHWEDRV